MEDIREIFLISNHETDKWDFVRLTEAIIDVLPVRQRESLTLSLGIVKSLSTKILERKIEVLKSRMWMVASASFAAAIVPVPGLSIAVDLGLITAEITFYRSQLGLPEEGSERFENLDVQLQERVSKFCFTTAVQVGTLLAAFSAESVIEEVTRFIPFIGSVIAGSMSFCTTYYFLQRSLKELEETAMMVLDDIAARSVKDLDID